MKLMPNQALQRTRPERRGCNRKGVGSWFWKLTDKSLSRSTQVSLFSSIFLTGYEPGSRSFYHSYLSTQSLSGRSFQTQRTQSQWENVLPELTGSHAVRGRQAAWLFSETQGKFFLKEES